MRRYEKFQAFEPRTMTSQPRGDRRAVSGVHAIAFAVFVLFYGLFFLPSLVDGKIIAPGDGILFYYPALTQGWQIWSTEIFSGFPIFGDPQFLTWYPLRILGFDYNAFLISGYILASFFTFVLLFEVTRSPSASYAAGFIYGMSGFMIGHAGHATFVHGGAWFPIVLWVVLRLSQSFQPRVWFVGVVAVGCYILGSHPQLVVYGMLVAALYALFLMLDRLSSARGRFRYMASVASFVVGGIGLTMVQLVPFVELQSYSSRVVNTFPLFTAYNFPLDAWPTIFFPMLFGHTAPYYGPYFGDQFGVPDFAGTAVYFGVVAILLTIIALVARGDRRQALFWFLLAAITFVFCLGGDTPLGRLAFEIPVINRFRAPARARFIIDMAFAITAGIGFAALIKHRLSWTVLGTSVAIFAGVIGTATLLTWQMHPNIQDAARKIAVEVPAFLTYKPIYLPLIFAALTVVVVALFGCTRAMALRIGLLGLIVSDLGHHAWFAYWRTSGVDPAKVAMTEPWSTVRDDLRLSGERFTSLEGSGALPSPLTVNVNMNSDVLSASGYSPLAPKHYFDATWISGDGITHASPNSPALDMTNVRWVDTGGMRFSRALYGRCGSGVRPPVKIGLTAPVTATRITIVSRLICGSAITQGTTVARIALRGPDSSGPPIAEVDLRAGIETAEQGADNPRLTSRMKHERAVVHAATGQDTAKQYTYIASAPITGEGSSSPAEIQNLEIVFPSDASSMIEFVSLSLDDETTGRKTAVKLSDLLFGDKTRWETPIQTPQGGFLVRNKRQLSFAWLVGETRRLPAEAAGAILHEGVLPDGSAFDVRALALVGPDGPVYKAKAGTRFPEGEVRVIENAPGRIVLEAQAPEKAFLVVSQTDYPGWHATVNGHPAAIIRTNGAFQGISVPTGSSRVVMEFSPRSLFWGGVISILTFAASLFVLAFFERRASPGMRGKPSRYARPD
jgi:hypothetical protein